MKTEEKPKSQRQAELVAWVKEHEIELVKKNAGPVAAREMLKAAGFNLKNLSLRQAIIDADCKIWQGKKVRFSDATSLTWKQWERIQGAIRKHSSLLSGDFSETYNAACLLGQRGCKCVSPNSVYQAASSMGWLGNDGRIHVPPSASSPMPVNRDAPGGGGE